MLLAGRLDTLLSWCGLSIGEAADYTALFLVAPAVSVAVGGAIGRLAVLAAVLPIAWAIVPFERMVDG